jgi:hypothetical protein
MNAATWWRFAAAALAGLGMCAVGDARADEAALRERVDRLERELQVRDGLIRNLLDRINALEDRLAKPAAAHAMPVRPMEATEAAAPRSSAAAPAADGREDTLAHLRASSAFDRPLIERGGLLLPMYRWELVPAISYEHSSSDRIVIDGLTVAEVLVIGDIVSEQVVRDTYQLALTGRIGLPWRSQFELRIPYATVREKSYSAQSLERTSTTSALGDIELAFSHQLTEGAGRDSNYLASLRWKSKSGQDPYERPGPQATFGSGYHGVQAALTGVWASDPAVFYGAVNYTANIPVTKSIGRIDPGDSYGLQAGLSLALNMDSSLSMALDQRYTRRTKLDGVQIPGSYLYNAGLALGVSHRTPSGRSIDLSTNIGLTSDSPDVQFTLFAPIR